MSHIIQFYLYNILKFQKFRNRGLMINPEIWVWGREGQEGGSTVFKGQNEGLYGVELFNILTVVTDT